MTSEERPSVYLETSFISYLTNPLSKDYLISAHQRVSQEWWEQKRDRYRLFVSDVVMEEIGAGNVEAVGKRLAVTEGLEQIKVDDQVRSFAGYLINKRILPQKASEDALHLALAAVNGIDCLLTWNCKHIANLYVMEAVRKVSNLFGYEAPLICTPLELMEDRNG